MHSSIKKKDFMHIFYTLPVDIRSHHHTKYEHFIWKCSRIDQFRFGPLFGIYWWKKKGFWKEPRQNYLFIHWVSQSYYYLAIIFDLVPIVVPIIQTERKNPATTPHWWGDILMEFNNKMGTKTRLIVVKFDYLWFLVDAYIFVEFKLSLPDLGTYCLKRWHLEIDGNKNYYKQKNRGKKNKPNQFRISVAPAQKPETIIFLRKTLNKN